MLPHKLAFVDIETTGMRSSSDRIIEIGILRVEDNKLTKSFKSLINPESYLPKEITSLTGITTQELEHAPTFRSIKDEIVDILQDCIFVAHNVRFDYAFLKHELLRENITYSAKHFCTVRLSRLLFPHWERHNLDAVIKECGLSCQNRHRAYDDAQVLYDFYMHLLHTLSQAQMEEALAKTMKKPSLPLHLPMEELEKLPEKPGVYIFYSNQIPDTKTLDTRDTHDTLPIVPLYVGKSVNIRNRVLSHFSADITSPKEMNIAQQIKRIETITTAGELGALLLESQMIKELLPLYNKKSRIKHELLALKKRTNQQGYDECYLEPITKIFPEQLQDFLGFYRSKKQAKAALADLALQHKLCEKLLGLEKTSTACFAYRLARCNGGCIGRENPQLYNLRLLTAISENKILPWPFEGAIMIQEDNGVKDEFGSKEVAEYFLINNWCYLGNIKVDPEGNLKDTIMQDVTFDLDVYKIVRQFLKNPMNRKKIKIIGTRTEKQSIIRQLNLPQQ
ncbi:MAG: exonuclease domain-containing protein [Candidatus Levyibacteriota bacterium]